VSQTLAEVIARRQRLIAFHQRPERLRRGALAPSADNIARKGVSCEEADQALEEFVGIIDVIVPGWRITVVDERCVRIAAMEGGQFPGESSDERGQIVRHRQRLKIGREQGGLGWHGSASWLSGTLERYLYPIWEQLSTSRSRPATSTAKNRGRAAQSGRD